MNPIMIADAQEFAEFAYECVKGTPGFAFHIAKDNCVWTGRLDSLDRDACEDKGLCVGTGEYVGGSIVNMPGDLTVMLATHGQSSFAPDAIAAFADWLREKNLNVTQDENDVLVDGKKVASWARATMVNGMCQSCIHFSIGEMDLDLVQEICTKPMVKTPGALSEYGITADDILNSGILNMEENENGNN